MAAIRLGISGTSQRSYRGVRPRSGSEAARDRISHSRPERHASFPRAANRSSRIPLRHRTRSGHDPGWLGSARGTGRVSHLPRRSRIQSISRNQRAHDEQTLTASLDGPLPGTQHLPTCPLAFDSTRTNPAYLSRSTMKKFSRVCSEETHWLSRARETIETATRVVSGVCRNRIDRETGERASQLLQHSYLSSFGTSTPPSIFGIPKCPPRCDKSSGLIDPDTTIKFTSFARASRIATLLTALCSNRTHSSLSPGPPPLSCRFISRFHPAA